MVEDYLDATIHTYNQNVANYVKATAELGMAQEIAHFQKFLPQNARILDAGCGWGRDSKAFAELGYTVTGIDMSEGLLDVARATVPKAKFIHMDLRELTFAPKSFDGIWACASLLHLSLTDIAATLKKFHELLTDDGVLFMYMKRDSGDAKVTESFTAQGDRHFTYISEEHLRNLVQEAGFTVESQYTFNERERFGENKRDLWWIVLFATKS